MNVIMDIVYIVIGIVLVVTLAFVAWTMVWARIDRPRKLKRPLRPIARCTVLDGSTLRDLAPLVGEAVKKIDSTIGASPSTYRQPSFCLVLFEKGRPRPFLLILQRIDNKVPSEHTRREIDLELRSGFSEPPAPRIASSRRVLGAIDKAVRTMPNMGGIRWTRDRDHWFETPFDDQPSR